MKTLNRYLNHLKYCLTQHLQPQNEFAFKNRNTFLTQIVNHKKKIYQKHTL